MNIQELDKYDLEDAVKFHDHLNPRLWGRDEHLLPEVQEKLRAIAADFQEFLGVPDLKLRDITISGSNAAYSYTPASDIDLHLVVDMPQDPVYQELFNAKKYQYNDQYDIRIGGADVELYVQPADQVHTSQGIYSILNQDWVSVPSRKRAHIDHSCVQAKTADLEQRILDAVKSQDSKRLDAIAQKIKTMRKAGLDAHGEFSCENLVFKMLRRSGALGKLKQARSDAHDRELSLMEKNKKKKCWSYNGYWNPGFGYAGQESGSDHVDQTASGDGLAEDQNFVVQFSAFRPNGERINKKFRVKAADKYVASDKIKEKFGAEYDTFTHPVFKFGKTDRGIASDYVASLARGLREQGVAEGSGNNTTAQKIFFARSNKAPKGWSYDHVGFITQDGKQIQMSGHKGNEVYVTNAVTDDPEFPKQKIKIVSLSKPVSVPTTNSVGAENCGTFVANVLQANGIKGIDTQKLYSVMKEPLKQDVAEDLGDHKKIRKAAQDFYQNSVGDVDTSKVDGYVDKANELLQKTDPSLRSRVKNILQRARKNPSIQGSVITAVGAILAGGVITSAQRYGLSPLQTNLLLQGVLNSVIPVMVKRVTGANWLDTLKYTLSSVLTGTGIAATTTMGEASTPDGVSPSTRMFLSETELTNTIREFIDRVCDRLKIEKHPDVEFHLDSDWSSQNKTFGRFDPDTCTLHVSLTDRHPMDIMRTVAHELVHCRQNELEKLPLDAGETGSRWENQANAIAGVIMRDMAQDRPEYFQDQMTTEDADDVDNMKWPGKPLNFPKGTVKVGVSDVYDWYKLGQQISDLDDADPRDFGKGAPETVLSFGSEPIEHKYIKDLKRLGMPTTDIDESASGYIPTRKQARDPRFSMALTQDIKPGEVGRQANKLKLKTTSKGEPQLLYKGLQNALEQFKATGEYLKESEQIEEIRMNPQSLRAEAEKIPALAGMEFEMIIPNITVDDEDFESEPDWDADERITSTDSIRNFFISDYNTRREVDRAIDQLWESYLDSDWLSEKKQEEWGDSETSAVTDWVRENESDELEDKAKEEIADETPDFGVGTEEYKKLVDDRYEKLVEARAEEITSDMGSEYDSAYEQWEENDWSELWNDDDWFTDWLDTEGITHMSNIQDLSWPHWTTPESNDIDLESVASSFQDEVAGNRSVRYAAKYHGLDRDRTTWIIEPDGSLNPGEGDSGLEFVSPPLSIKEMIDTLNQVYAWAKASDAYTNRSTGLHINVSVEGFAKEKLDYVKLALLLGDEYVLNQFGRIANTYTRSAFQKIKNKLLDTPEKITQYFDLMRQGLSKTASEMIHAPSTEKFTSINVKTGYIEFRSPGGDWLNKNPQEIENTLLRFVVALDAALDPNKYRQEYLKKLYKILAPRSDQDAIAIFARYSAGELPQTALRSFIKQIQLQRKISKEKDLPVKKYVWDVRRNGPDSDGPGMEVASTSSQEALEIAAREWNLSPAERARVSVKPLRPVDQPEPA